MPTTKPPRSGSPRHPSKEVPIENMAAMDPVDRASAGEDELQERGAAGAQDASDCHDIGEDDATVQSPPETMLQGDLRGFCCERTLAHRAPVGEDELQDRGAAGALTTSDCHDIGEDDAADQSPFETMLKGMRDWVYEDVLENLQDGDPVRIDALEAEVVFSLHQLVDEWTDLQMFQRVGSRITAAMDLDGVWREAAICSDTDDSGDSPSSGEALVHQSALSFLRTPG